MSLLTDRYRSDLVALVDEYQTLSKLADSGISRAVFGSDNAFIKRLRRGENVTTEKARSLEIWLRDRLAASTSPRPASLSSAAVPAAL